MNPSKICFIPDRLRITLIVDGFVEFDINASWGIATEAYNSFLKDNPKLIKEQEEKDIQIIIEAYR